MKALSILLALALSAGACTGGGESLTVYSGRTENLIGPLLESFTEETGIDVDVKYGNSADLALLISEEGERSPADVFISQSPGAVGFLVEQDLLQPLQGDVLGLVGEDLRNGDGYWIGLSGRVRVVVYNSNLIDPAELPATVFDLVDEQFRGDVGVAPANGSFQDFVTAMRTIHGDEVTLDWLTGLEANDAQTYANNTAIVQAVGRGEIPLGLVNHYYNERALAEDPGLPSANYYFPDGDVGSLVIVTAMGVLVDSDESEAANRFVEFMLGEAAQTFYRDETLEYPIAAGIAASPGLPSLESLEVATYDFDELGGGLTRTKELIDASGLEAP